MPRLHRIIIALAALAIGRGANAQAVDSLSPRAGTWAAEAAPFVTAASLLRFTSPRRAWLLGATVFFTHSDRPGTGPVAPLSTSSTSLTAQLGHRWYALGSGDAHLRPLYGLGAIGSYGRTDVSGSGRQTQWSAGAYGELGAVWFFTPHVSLGADGQLQALWGRTSTDPVTFSTSQGELTGRQTLGTFTLSANVARLIGSVYF